MANDITIIGSALIPQHKKAIDNRRAIAPYIERIGNLTKAEQSIYQASARKQIGEMRPEEVAEALRKMLPLIAIDIGYNIPQDRKEWQYTQTRIFSILQTYYSQISLQDFKLAFELASVGQLDEYLPKDAKGNPDAKHYQKFNADYIGKILKAYQRKQIEIETKVNDALSNAPKAVQLLANEKEEGRKFMTEKRIAIFLEYKYRGKLANDPTGLAIVWEWLRTQGYADEAKPTESERQKAYNDYRHRYAMGRVNVYKASFVLREGIYSSDLDYASNLLAQKREIKATFDRMIKEEIQIKEIA